jgi:uncharacterized protein
VISQDDLNVRTPPRRAPAGAGIGLRLSHIAEIVATRPQAGWLEIHPENFLSNPHAFELLTELSHIYPISRHTVGISVGSVGGINLSHLARIRTLADRIDPVFVSGHLAWSTYKSEYLNDLLPLPFNMESLRVVIAHVNEVQDALGRSYLVENPASYVAFANNRCRETEFLSELEIQGARGEFQINRLDASEFLFRKSISEQRTLGAAAERALKETRPSMPGRVLYV